MKRLKDILRDPVSAPGRRWLVLGLSLGLVACAGAQDPRQAPEPGDRPAAGSLRLVAQLADASDQILLPLKVTPRPAPQVPPAARQAVVDAYEAMNKGRWADVTRLAPLAAADPVLGMYPAYWLLRKRVQDRTLPVPEAEIRRFLDQADNPHLAERIRADWILASVRASDYAGALQIPPVADPSASVRCALLMARHQLGQGVSAAEVLDTVRPTADCRDLVDQLAADQVLDRPQLNSLLHALLEAGPQAPADRMAAVIFDTPDMVQYAALIKNPLKWLKAHPKPRRDVDIELATIALSRLARGGEREKSARYVQDHWVGQLPKQNMEWVWGQFGLVAALNVEPDAARWYRLSGDGPKTDYNHAWQVRAELRQAPIDWARVAAAIDTMSDRQAAEPVWRYWKGRALAAAGQADSARALYQSIADDQSFYGLLALEELGLTPSLPPQPEPLDPAWVAQARSHPGLQRAVALFDQGWRREAVPEWNFALRGMNDAQLRGAAEYAREEHIYDRVVNTSLLTRQVSDFSQRFIAPFEGQVAAKAHEIDLDPAWVYGLIRQESRFITDARSRVGASGLMQLMPATARWVAKKIGMKNFKPSQVNDFDTNTILGTRYLDMVLRDLGGSQMLATAGYNAGPGRPKRWRKQLLAPVEGAIFAETIPFTETRLYVKNVLSNTAYYAMLFTGEPQSLKAMLGTVRPDGRTATALP